MTLTSAAEFNKFDTAAYAALTGVAGTNTITATGPANLTLAATNPPLWFTPAATNTDATTLNITPSGGAALGAKNVFYNGVACVGGEIRISVPCAVVYDGTQYNLLTPARAANIVLTTEQASTSGTSIDFTGIPAGVKRITILLKGVSTNGTSNLLVQIGDAGGIEASGYISTAYSHISGVAGSGTNTTGFIISATTAATDTASGEIVLTLENSAGFAWICSGNIKNNTTGMSNSAGEKALSAELDRVRITTVNGSDAFDAGAINISYE